MIIFAYFNKISFLKLADNITSVIPIWLGLWRIWNYINKELLGFYPYLWPFWVEKDWKTHFPSPLLEAFLEWIVLFIILNFIYKKTKEPWVVSAFFLIWYWIFRIFIEFFRIPDEQIGYLIGHLTMWQLLSIPMILVWIWFITYKKNVWYKIFQ
jgi:phosphatidylglycerol:prolipoprotein diacylglycerol transferase